METDTAGLDLCEYIRETKANKVVQLFIRTGQPGVAPERHVIDHYDINGYFTKVEATEDKLYSLVKTGVRQYLSFLSAMAMSMMTTVAIAAAGSRESLRGVGGGGGVCVCSPPPPPPRPARANRSEGSRR
jgi:hypothetical protein